MAQCCAVWVEVACSKTVILYYAPIVILISHSRLYGELHSDFIIDGALVLSCSGDVGIGLNVRRMQTQLMGSFTTAYSLRPVSSLKASVHWSLLMSCCGLSSDTIVTALHIALDLLLSSSALLYTARTHHRLSAFSSCALLSTGRRRGLRIPALPGAVEGVRGGP